MPYSRAAIATRRTKGESNWPIRIMGNALRPRSLDTEVHKSTARDDHKFGLRFVDITFFEQGVTNTTLIAGVSVKSIHGFSQSGMQGHLIVNCSKCVSEAGFWIPANDFCGGFKSPS